MLRDEEETAAEPERPRPLRVAVFLESYLQPDQTFIFRQVNALPHCTVCVLARHRIPNHPYSEENVRYFGSSGGGRKGWVRWKLFRLRQRITRRYAWLTSRESERLNILLRDFAPEIVHAHWAPDAMLVAPLVRTLGVPLLVHFHGYDASRLINDRIYVASLRALFREMRFAITVAEGMRQRLVTLGAPEDRIRCHYTGVPEEYFTSEPRRPPKPGRFVLLQVGRLADVKGHRFALAAIARGCNNVPGLSLRIIGDGELRRDIEMQIAALAIPGHVNLVGWLKPADVISEMQQAHALILPGCTAKDGGIEGLPNVAVEAMASGLPVIGTRHGGISEALRYSETNWLAPEADVEALQDRIEQLASHGNLWARLSEEGRQIAREHFHLPTQNIKLEALYRSLLPGFRHSPTA